VPDVVGAPGALGSRAVDPLDIVPLPEVLDDPDVDPAEPELLLPAGVPDVPVDWPGVAAPGALKVPEVVGAPGAFGSRAAEPDDFPELIPDEEPEVIEPDLFSPAPIAPQAPSTKTHAKGMIHLFMKELLKRLEKIKQRHTSHTRRDVVFALSRMEINCRSSYKLFYKFTRH
jgi:hypothetical protein